MATAREIITRSLRRIRVVSIMDSPSAEVAKHSLDAFNDLLSGYEADNLSTETVVISGNTSNGSKTITNLDVTANLYNTDDLAIGMRVTGTGVTGQIHTIVSVSELTLTEAATVTATGVSLTFSSLPMDDSLTEALVAVLAVRLAEDFGASVGPVLARDARRGQAQIDGVFLKVPRSELDATLTDTPSRRFYGELYNG